MIHWSPVSVCYGTNQPTEKYKKLSLKSTNLINYTSSDNYNLGATLTIQPYYKLLRAYY